MEKNLEYYLNKARETNEEVQLKDNQIEISKNNVFGSIKGKDLSSMSAPDLYEKIKTIMPKLYQAIEEKGGLKILIGQDDLPDISINMDRSFDIKPDSK